MAPSIVVSVHDVSPSRLEATARLLAELDRVGAVPRVLKVVPLEPGASPDRWSRLLRLLRAEQDAGSEILLHGCSHRAEGRFHGRALDVLRARLFAPDDAEFMTIDRGEAARRLAVGRRSLTAAGLEVAGFCAPGWLAPSWLPELLAELGFSHYVGMMRLWDLRRGRRSWLPWAGQIGAGPFQEALVGLGGRVLLSAGSGLPAVKVFFHPPDTTCDPSVDRVLIVLERLLAHRRPVTYAQLVA